MENLRSSKTNVKSNPLEVVLNSAVKLANLM